MKTERDSPRPESSEAAAAWARRCASGMSAAERAEFKAWLAADADHPRELARANRHGVDCDWAWQNGTVDEILSGVNARVRRRTRVRGLAGAAALLLLAAWFVRPGRESEPALAPSPAAALAIIRPTVHTLPDGSTVELKDDAHIRTDFRGAQRLVSLERGTAYFQVVKDANRPFVVRAAGLSVQALGTAFTVELAHQEIKVVVAEGKVRVDPARETAASAVTATPAAALVSLIAGNSAVIPLEVTAATAPTARELDGGELRQQLDWRIPKLEFTRTPLREVIAQMNRHNARQFVVRDEAVGDLRVSGVLRADKMDTLADMLESDFGVRVERTPQEIVLRRTP